MAARPNDPQKKKKKVFGVDITTPLWYYISRWRSEAASQLTTQTEEQKDG
jgi:hypothetical protein